MNAFRQKHVIFIGVFILIAVAENNVWNYWRRPPVQFSQTPPQRTEPARLDNGAGTALSGNDGRQAEAARKAAEVAAQHEQYLARYLNSGIVRKPGMKMVALAVVSENQSFNFALDSAIAGRFKSDSVDIVTTCFRPAFVSDHLFDRAFGGANDVLDKLDLGKSLDVLLLGREDVQYSSDPSLENVITANTTLRINAFSIATGQSQSWTFTASGAGFKRDEALAMAEERLAKQIARDTKMSLAF